MGNETSIWFKDFECNRTSTQMQSISGIKIFTSNIIDLGGAGPFQKHCGSVCRAGGEPSTWFPPGTRGAVHNIEKLIFWFSFFGIPWEKASKFHEISRFLKIVQHFQTSPWETQFKPNSLCLTSFCFHPVRNLSALRRGDVLGNLWIWIWSF